MDKKAKSNRERRELLAKFEMGNGRISKLKLYDRFMARMDFLHRDCFYDGIYTIEEIELNLEKVNQYIKDMEKI